MDDAIDNAMHQRRHEGGAYRRIELITGSLRRRRWTAEEKMALVGESLQPGINVSALARLRGIDRGLLQSWRRAALRDGAEHSSAFIPIRIEETVASCEAADLASGVSSGAAVSSAPAITAGMIEIENGGLRVRISGSVDVSALHAVLAYVGRRG